MDNFWSKDVCETSESIPPKEYIEEQIKYLLDLTDGKIIGRIKEYEGEYKDRYEGGTTIALSDVVCNSYEFVPAHKEFDVQDVLGEQQRFVYEFYLTSKATPKYKYRIAILDYSISFYPLYVTLERVLAQELEVDERTEIKSEPEFIDLLKKMLNSKRILTVVANLMKINK